MKDPDVPKGKKVKIAGAIVYRARVEKHIKNTYLQRVDAPVGVKPALRCWMELCE